MTGRGVRLADFEKYLAPVSLQQMAEQPAPDALPAKCRRDGQIENLPFSIGDLPRDREPDHQALFFGDQALVTEVVGRIPLRRLRRGRLDFQNRCEILFRSGSNEHTSM